jgi:hypothetical protein
VTRERTRGGGLCDTDGMAADSRARAWRTAGGVVLLAAPLLLVLGELSLLQVRGSGDALAVIGRSVPAWQAGQLMLFAWSALLVPVGLVCAHLARGRARAWADAGAVLTVAGALAGLALATVNLVVGEMARLGPAAALDALLDRLGALTGGLDLLSQARLLGLLALGLGLYRAAAAPRWAVALLLGGLAVPGWAAALQFVIGSGGLAASGWLAAAALQLAGLGWLGLRLLRRDDASWIEPPPQRGFARPGRFAAAMIVLFLPGAGVSAGGFAAWVIVALALGLFRLAPDQEDQEDQDRGAVAR